MSAASLPQGAAPNPSPERRGSRQRQGERRTGHGGCEHRPEQNSFLDALGPHRPGQLASDDAADANERDRRRQDENRNRRGRQRRRGSEPAQPPHMAAGDGVTKRRRHL